MKKNTGFFSLILHTFAVSFTELPLITCIYFFAAGGSGIAVAATTWFRQQFFDRAEQLTSGGAVSAVVTAGILMGAFTLFNTLLESGREIWAANYVKHIQSALGKKLIRKASHMPAISFESSAMLDFINKAYKGIEGAAVVTAEFLFLLLTQGFYFLFMGTYLYRIQPMLLLMLLLSFLPSIAGTLIRFKVYAHLEDDVVLHRRKKEHYGRCICDREFARETRMLGAFPYFFKLFHSSQSQETALNWNASRKSCLLEMGLRLVMLTGYAGTLGLLFYYLINGQIGIGIFAAVFSSLDTMFDQIEVAFNYCINNISEHMGSAENYLKFMSAEETAGTETPELDWKSIKLENVSFSYPGRTEKALEHINLQIKGGETIAVVGKNGSGKSTLVRMLCGIYTPDEGQVLVDGHRTSDLAPSALFAHISAVFQKYSRYKMTLGENIAVAGSSSDRNALEYALQKADLDARSPSFPAGLNTMLGKDFGGTDISGGQWQRISIARGFYRPHRFIVLDEPTAAIDPLEEKRIYEKFSEISQDKTAVIVTHRLGSTRNADRIIVMDRGRIAGIGTHEKLMEHCPTYQKLYQAQAKWYN